MTETPAFLTRPALWPLSHGEWALADDLVFRDLYGVVCTVVGGTRLNGASIPKMIWPVIGHPFETDYVYPAALHDAQCGERMETDWLVHDRFFRALKAEKVAKWKANVMGYAVQQWGPTWTTADEWTRALRLA